MVFIKLYVEDDSNKRVKFCDIISERIIANPNPIPILIICDTFVLEMGAFFLNGKVKTHNCRYQLEWRNLICFMKNISSFLRKQTRSRVFIRLHLLLLHAKIVAPPEFHLNIKFQQNGAPLHYFRESLNYWEANYRDIWIGRRGLKNWRFHRVLYTLKFSQLLPP